MNEKELPLRYGINPHQTPARVYVPKGALPFKVLNGQPGYINLLDALHSWQLVKELKEALSLPAAASFKHVSPAGAAVFLPLSEELKKAYFLEGAPLSPLATAYARARGSDRVSSFGDFVALSEPVDIETAQLLSAEVSDGIIAPGYEPEALALLSKKKKGKYVVLEIDPDYEPEEQEVRQVFGIFFEQKRNSARITKKSLERIVTENRELPPEAQRDLLLSLITLKYTQSNSIVLAFNGQAIGIGAGQQSRIHCTKLAASKAQTWFLRQHPKVLHLKFKANLSRPQKDNAIDQYLRDDLTEPEKQLFQQCFEEVPEALLKEEKEAWLQNLKHLALGSDGFIPFRDNIDQAHKIGVSYIAQPGGSLRDEEVIAACNEYRMVMVFTSLRLFHH